MVLTEGMTYRILGFVCNIFYLILLKKNSLVLILLYSWWELFKNKLGLWAKLFPRCYEYDCVR